MIKTIQNNRSWNLSLFAIAIYMCVYIVIGKNIRVINWISNFYFVHLSLTQVFFFLCYAFKVASGNVWIFILNLTVHFRNKLE